MQVETQEIASTKMERLPEVIYRKGSAITQEQGIVAWALNRPSNYGPGGSPNTGLVGHPNKTVTFRDLALKYAVERAGYL